MKTDIESLQKTMIISLAWIMILFLSLGSATYAWFTGNQRVSTSRASGRAAEDDLALLLGTSEGDLAADTEVEISRVNSAEEDILLPVSTADLQTWARSIALTEEGDGGYGTFEEVDIDQNGTYCYHGQIYMEVHTDRPESFEGMKATIYLEENSDVGAVGTDDDGSGILSAARLGFVFNSDTSEAVIFYFDDASETSDRHNNTYVGSTQAGDNQVLEISGTSATAVDDPAVAISTAMMTEDMTDYPEQALATLDLNTAVPVDIYFYLEGCDPDCVESISTTSMTMQLAFYAVLTQE